MSERDLQLGGGYTYQWQCAILLALNYFFEPLRYNPTLFDLINGFLERVDTIRLEGKDQVPDVDPEGEEEEIDVDLEDIALVTGDRQILIQVKTKQAEGERWTPTDPLLLKALYRFYNSPLLVAQPDNIRFVFLTNRSFNPDLVEIKSAISGDGLGDCPQADDLSKHLDKYARREKCAPLDADRFRRMLARTALVEYLSVDAVKANVQRALREFGRSDWEQAYALLFEHCSDQSTRLGGGSVTRTSIIQVLGPGPVGGLVTGGGPGIDIEWLESYLQGVQDDFAFHLRGGETITDEQAVGRYMELLVRKRVEPGKEKNEDIEPREGRLADFVKEPGTRLLVFGEGGSGKTTSLKKLASDAANDALADPTTPIPIYVKLNVFNAENQGFDRLLQMVSNAATGLNEPELTALWRKSQRPFLFLLDGFNEVGRDFRPACKLALQEFMRRGVHRYVVTSRPVDEAENLAKQVDDIPVLDIVQLDEEQIQGFLARHGTADLYEQMGDRLKELARNPFMLWALAQSCAGLPEGELPTNIGQLYRTFIDGYIFGILRDERERPLMRGREQAKDPPPTRYDYERVKKPVLAELAYRMTGQARTQVALGDDLEDKLIKGLEAAEEANRRRKQVMPIDWTADDFLNEAVHNGVLRQVGNAVEFMHQSVQEYFAAIAVSGWPTEKIIELTPALVWRHTKLWGGGRGYASAPFFNNIIMLSGLLPDSSELLEALSRHNPLLAAHCLVAAATVQPGTRKALQDLWLTMLIRRHERYRWLACQCLAAAKLNEAEVIDQLIDTALGDEESQVQQKAAEALAQMSSDIEVYRLVELGIEKYGDDRKLEWIAEALRREDPATVVRLLIDAWRRTKRDEPSHRRAELLLGAMPSNATRHHLERILRDAINDNDHALEEAAADALRQLDSWKPRASEREPISIKQIIADGLRPLNKAVAIANSVPSHSIPELIEYLSDDAWMIRIAAAKELAKRQVKEAVTYLVGAFWQAPYLEQALSMLSILKSLLAEAEVSRLVQAGFCDDDKAVRLRAAVALAASGDSDAVHMILRSLQEEDDGLRAEAAWALGETRAVGADVPLVSLLWSETPGEVLAETIMALGKIGSEKAVASLVKALLVAEWREKYPELRRYGSSRGTWGDFIHEALEESDARSQIIDLLREPLKDPDSSVRATAVREIGRVDAAQSQILELLGKALQDPESSVCEGAVHELGRLQGAPSQVLELLGQALKHPDSSVREAVVYELGERQSELTESLLIEATLLDGRRAVREAAAEALRWFDGDCFVHQLMDELDGPDRSRRVVAIEALGWIEDEASVDPLLAALEDDSGSVRVAAAAALCRMKADVDVDLIGILVQTASQDTNQSVRQQAAQALQEVPGGTDALYAPFRDALRACNYSEVIKLVEDWLPLLPEDAYLYWLRGCAYRYLEQSERALADFDEVTALYLNFAPVQRERSWALDALKRHEEALAAARRAAEIEPGDAGYQFLLGWYAYVAGAYAVSITASRRALELAPDTPMAAFNLGLAQLASDQVNEARDAYQQGIEICEGLDTETARANLNGALGDLDGPAEIRSDLASVLGEIRQLLEAAHNRLAVIE